MFDLNPSALLESGLHRPTRCPMDTCTYPRHDTGRMNSLCVVTEERREDDRGSYHEQNRPQQRQEALRGLSLMGLHPDVDDEGGDDGHNASDRIADVEHVGHHRHGEVVGLCQGARAPRVVHATGPGRRKLRDQYTGHAQKQGIETFPILPDPCHSPQ